MPDRTVLLVEDNEDTRLIYGAVLRHYGYTVLTAADGVEGLSMAQAHLPDLVLLDISLPRLSGWEVARQLLADERTRHIVIVGLSANAEESDLKRARDIGLRGYIPKPASPRNVVEEIERLLALDAGPDSPPVSAS